MSTWILFSTTPNCHVQLNNLEQSEFWHHCGRLIYHSTIECVYKINIGLHWGLRPRSAFLVMVFVVILFVTCVLFIFYLGRQDDEDLPFRPSSRVAAPPGGTSSLSLSWRRSRESHLGDFKRELEDKIYSNRNSFVDV